MATLGVNDLGTVRSERQSKMSQLFQQPLPRQNSSHAILLDIFGLKRTIQITGTLTGTFATQATFIAAIETIMNGTQEGVTFVSGQTSTPNKTVFVDVFDWTTNAGAPTKLDYSLTLIEGAAIS